MLDSASGRDKSHKNDFTNLDGVAKMKVLLDSADSTFLNGVYEKVTINAGKGNDTLNVAEDADFFWGVDGSSVDNHLC